MSEDQQQSPESASSEPITPTTPSGVGQSRTEVQKTSKMARPTESPVQRLVKTQSIKALRGTISLLEGIVDKLETEPPVVIEVPPGTTPPATSPDGAPVSTTAIQTPQPDTVSSVPEPASEATVAETPAVAPQPTAPVVAPEQVPTPSKPKLTDRVLPTFRSFQAFWNAMLQRVRSLLPQAWNEKLSDWALTGAIAAIIGVFLVSTASLLPKTPAQVAKAPPNTIEAPAELKAPKEPQPVAVEPPPTPELTPEQALIAGIQKQVAEITDHYGNGLIQSIEANFLTSRLIVKVSNGWYDLKESQQNKLADEVLSRSGELDFSKLEITDSKGALLARNPVVGSHMVILKRQELAANL